MERVLLEKGGLIQTQSKFLYKCSFTFSLHCLCCIRKLKTLRTFIQLPKDFQSRSNLKLQKCTHAHMT